MAVECTAANLMALSKCFQGLSKPQLEAIKAYLLAVEAGVEPDPGDLMAAAKCFTGLSIPQLKAIQTYLLCQIANITPPVGETDGLIWGPSPETVDSISDNGDSFLSSINNLFTSAYTTLSFGNPTTVTNGVQYTVSGITTELEFRLLETVGADMSIAGTALESIVADSLVSVGVDLQIGDCPALTVASFESLVLVPGLLYLQNNTLLTSFTLPALTTTNQIQCDGGGLLTLSLPALTAYPPLGITADGTLQTLNLPVCTDDGAGQLNIDLGNMTGLVALNLNALVTFNSTWNLDANPQLQNLNIDSLITVGGSLAPGGTQITVFTAPSLQTINGSLSNAEATLQSVSVPSLVTITVNANFNGSTAFSSFSAPLWVPTDGTLIDFNGCALGIPSVELILRRCVLAGVVACTIDLSGGTNAGTASLSAQGQADVVTLGAQLTINP